MRVLELYAGIGGVSQALANDAHIVAAVDHNHYANQVYRYNFNHRLLVKNLESIKDELLQSLTADLWWLSPPCQPYTIRGAQRDLDDPRSRSFIRLISAIAILKPTFIALENVPWFKDSSGHALLLSTLKESGYDWQEHMLCPTELGVPNIRKRYYLVAGRAPLVPRTLTPIRSTKVRLSDLLEPNPSLDLMVSERLLDRFGDSFHVVDADDSNAVTACFTSAYTNSPVYAGSYLRQDGRIRVFSPQEILRILGFPTTFKLPGSLSRRQQYKLIGNSLSLRPVQHVLKSIPREREV